MATNAEVDRARLEEQKRTLELIRELDGQLRDAAQAADKLRGWAEANPLGVQYTIPRESREWREAKAALGLALVRAEELREELP